MGKFNQRYSIDLDRYILSRGNILPRDWHNFIMVDGTMPKCLFCSNPNANHAVYQFKITNLSDFAKERKGEAHSTGTYCCDYCIKDVEQMEKTLFNMDRNQTKYANQDDSEEDHPTDFEESVMKCINDYVFRGVLPDEWYKYVYLHPPEVAIYRTHCFFCTAPPDENTYSEGGGLGFQKIVLPVVHGDLLNGGEASCCPSCLQMYVDLAFSSVVKDLCPACGEAYPVTDLELDYRQVRKTVGRHMCPDCTVERQKAHLDMHNDDGYLRMVVTPCHGCNDVVSTDLTLEGETGYCSDCVIEDYYYKKFDLVDVVPYKVFCKDNRTIRLYIRENGKFFMKTAVKVGKSTSLGYQALRTAEEAMNLLIEQYNEQR